MSDQRVEKLHEVVGKLPKVNLGDYYTKTQVDEIIPEVPSDISELTDNEGLLSHQSGGLTKAQALTVGLL